MTQSVLAQDSPATQASIAQSSRMTPSQRRAHWKELFGRQAASGLSIKAFCEREKVSYQGFFDYKRRLRDASVQTNEKINSERSPGIAIPGLFSEGGKRGGQLVNWIVSPYYGGHVENGTSSCRSS